MRARLLCHLGLNNQLCDLTRIIFVIQPVFYLAAGLTHSLRARLYSSLYSQEVVLILT